MAKQVTMDWEDYENLQNEINELRISYLKERNKKQALEEFIHKFFSWLMQYAKMKELSDSSLIWDLEEQIRKYWSILEPINKKYRIINFLRVKHEDK